LADAADVAAGGAGYLSRTDGSREDAAAFAGESASGRCPSGDFRAPVYGVEALGGPGSGGIGHGRDLRQSARPRIRHIDIRAEPGSGAQPGDAVVGRHTGVPVERSLDRGRATGVRLEGDRLAMKIQRQLLDTALGLLGLLAIFGIWQLIAISGLVSTAFMPAPSAALESLRLGVADGSLVRGFLATSIRLLQGWLLASLLGVALGAVIGLSSPLRELLQPTLEFLRPLLDPDVGT